MGAALFLILGLMIFAIGRMKEEVTVLRPYSDVFQLVGMITALGALFAFTFEDIFDTYGDGRYLLGGATLEYGTMIVAAGALTLVLVLATTWLHRRREQEFTITGVE